MAAMLHQLRETAKSVYTKDEGGRFDILLLKRLIPHIKPYWAKVLLGALFMLALALLALPAPYLMKLVFDKVLPNRNASLLSLILIILFIIQFSRSAISIASRYYLDTLNQEVVLRIKRELLYRILRLPLSFFDKNQSGYILSRIGEVEGLSFFFSSALFGLLVSFFEFIFCLGILFSLNLRLTFITLMILPLFFLAAKFQSRGMRKLSREAYERGATAFKKIQDSLTGVDVIKYYGAEKRETDRIHGFLNAYKVISIRRNLVSSLSSEVLSSVGAAGGLIVLWLSGLDIIKGSFTVGSYIAFSAYIGKLYGPTQLFANMGMAFQPARVSLERVTELMKLAGEDDNKNAIRIDHTVRRVEFRNVYFSYDTHPVLLDVSFRINSGDKILLSGPNGSGKSTIIKLILGLYKAKKGSILIDDHDINEVSLSSLRQQFSVVSQNTFLFNDTVKNNILYSKPDASAEEIREAARLSGVRDFVCNLERGMDTEIGERGARLSGGERQKISIARAILRNSGFIIFDEATAHLDAESEIKINSLIQNDFVDKICVVISHRRFEIPGINRILAIDEGKIINN